MLACASYSTSGSNTIVRVFSDSSQSEVTISGTFASNAGRVRLGLDTISSHPFLGFMHEVRVYKAFMSRADLTNEAIFSVGCPGCSSCPYDHLCLCSPAFINSLRDCSIFYGTDTTTSSTCNQINESSPGYASCTSCNSQDYLDTAKGLCLACPDSCNTCTSATNCQACKSSKATLKSGLCVCNSGYFWESASSTCSGCGVNCTTCDSANSCLTCKDTNASPVIGVCQCNAGFVDAGSASVLCVACPDGTYYSDRDCLPCFEDCLTCPGFPGCTFCKDPRAYLKSGGICECTVGTYKDSWECHNCAINCHECNDAISCDVCESPNAEFLVSSCVCQARHIQTQLGPHICELCLDGTYADFDTCKDCRRDCAACLDETECETCLDAHAIEDPNCPCEAGFYKEDFQCFPCLEGCDLCSSATVCLKCTDSHAVITGGLCNCIEGYVPRPPFPLKCEACQDGTYYKSGSCQPCLEGCRTCSSGSQCLTCRDPHAVLSSSNLCVCDEGYYAPTNEWNCLNCPENCRRCSSSWACTECYHSLAAVKDHKCLCKAGTYLISQSPLDCGLCPVGTYLRDIECIPCSDECKTCASSTQCLSCKDNKPHLTAYGNCTTGLCPSGYFLDGDACSSCSDACEICGSKAVCIKCTANATLSSGTCKCSSSFLTMKGNCRGPVNLIVELINPNTLHFTLFPEIDGSLSLSDIKLQFDDGNVVGYTLTSLGNSTYEITLTGNSTFVDTEAVLTVADHNVGVSLDNKSHPTDGSRWHYFIPILTNAVLATGLVCGTFSGSWSPTWSFFNTLELISYIPMKRIPLPQVLVDFFVDLIDFSFFPGIFANAPDDGKLPGYRATRLKIDTTSFLLNSSQSLTILFSALVVWPFLKLAHRTDWKPLHRTIDKLLLYYKFNFFLRFSIESYMQLTFFIFLQLTSPSLSSAPSILSLSLCCIFAVTARQILFFAFPFVIYIQAKRNISNIKEERYLKIFGSLFDEFKNNRGFVSALFYFLYCVRRIVYVTNLFFLQEYPNFQVSINTGFSMTVLAFIIYFKAFTPSRYLYLNIWLELVCTSVFGLTGLWLYGLNETMSNWLVIGIIVGVTSCCVVTVLVVLYDLIVAIKEWHRKFKVTI